jgi:hypothetical protein
MKGVKDFLRGTLVNSSNYDGLPTTAFYTGENVQPQSFQVDCGIHIPVNHQRFLLIPITSDAAIGKNDFIPIPVFGG